MSTPPIIRVTGEAELDVPPDFMSLAALVICNRMDYEEGLRYLTDTVGKVKTAVENQDLAVRICARELRVESKYEYVNGRRDFSGFEASQRMLFRFPVNYATLSSVMTAIVNVAASPELQLSYEIKDEQAHRAEALKRAFADARQKAEAVAEAAGGSLSSLKVIDSSFNYIELERREPQLLADPPAVRSALAIPEIDPQELRIKAHVNVEWMLEE